MEGILIKTKKTKHRYLRLYFHYSLLLYQFTTYPKREKTMTKNKHRRKLKTFFFFSSISFLINYSFIKLEIIKLEINQVFFFHIFLLTLFFISTSIIQKNINNKKKPSVFFTLSLNLFRILICLFFLYKQGIFSQNTTTETAQQITINFFTVYFLYLFLEVLLLKKK